MMGGATLPSMVGAQLILLTDNSGNDWKIEKQLPYQRCVP